MAGLFIQLPTSFLPSEDQGQLMVQFTLPAGATKERTEKVRGQINDYFQQNEAKDVPVMFAVTGTGFGGSGQNSGQAFASLSSFDDRKNASQTVDAIAARANVALSQLRDAQVFIMTPPSIHGLGQSNGFTFELLNASGMPREEFVALRDKLIDAASSDPKLARVRASTLPDTPQLRVAYDDAKLSVLGLTDADAAAVLSSAWGGTYVNDFVDRGRIKKVYMQADASDRALPQDLNKWFVRSSGTTADGVTKMVPFSSFASMSWEMGPNSVSRFNGRSSYEINGEPASGYSSGDAMAEMVSLQQKIAPGTSYAWSGLSYQENETNGQTGYLYGLSIVVVFLCLAALYESWSVPFAVLLVIPLGVVGAVVAVSLRGLENNIFLQVGLLTTIGLASKNAILIVEFAEAARRQGRDALESALEAARIRLRPILMTSLAFIAGVIPLAVATGAGANSRIAIGTAVLGGMITGTALAVFYVPMFFVLVARILHRQSASAPAALAIHSQP